MFNLDIVNQNLATQERHQCVINREVTKACIDNNGEWLGTVELRDDGETNIEIKLKFWWFDSLPQSFTLNTCVNLPHHKKIYVIKFKPVYKYQDKSLKQPLAVTTSEDRKFKLWGLVDDADTDIHGKQLCWNCQSVGFYRNMVAKDADFSTDGSLLAVSFDHIATLWESETNALKATLCHPKSEENISQILFGQKSCCHLVVCATPTSITVWNILSLTVAWNIQCEICLLARDLSSDIMATFSKDKTLYIFRPSNPEPVYIHENITCDSVLGAAFIPKTTVSSGDLWWQCNSQLYFMTEKQELLTITDEPDPEPEDSQLKLQQNLSTTPFGQLIARKHKTDVEPSKHETQLFQGILGLKEVNQILEVPSHVLPPVGLLCSNFMTSLLTHQTRKTWNVRESDEEDEDGKEKETSQSETDEEDKQGVKIAKNDNETEIKNDKLAGGELNVTQEQLLEKLTSVESENYSWLKELWCA
ncbi:WD repeat-containing protein l(2)05287 [Tachypleus tridentatus]|uniref:WD repeat-containing protein l(2)05287 n=1 Tax=Tachypleus tridentatus TaxID=6853 RepID=UPI003FD132E7